MHVSNSPPQFYPIEKSANPNERIVSIVGNACLTSDGALFLGEENNHVYVQRETLIGARALACEDLYIVPSRLGERTESQFLIGDCFDKMMLCLRCHLEFNPTLDSDTCILTAHTGKVVEEVEEGTEEFYTGPNYLKMWSCCRMEESALGCQVDFHTLEGS